jgi:AraC-like DNA-binding protein
MPPMDALSHVLSLLNVRTAVSVGLKAGGDWSMSFPTHEGVKFNALVRGSCWLAVDGVAAPVRLEAGDCFLLTRGRPFLMGSDLSLPPVDARVAFAHPVDGVAHYGSADDVHLIGGRFSFDPGDGAMLLDALPPVVHVSGASTQATTLRWILERLAEELSDAQPGAPLMAEHLSHIMFVQVLRVFLATGAQPAGGWLRALSDARVGHAIRLMHEQPARRWTLGELAGVIGVSRSTLALRFKTMVGVAPLDYLLRWRMRLARHALRNEASTVLAVALSLGYESESAFSNAFKRIVGSAPTHYRRDAIAVADGKTVGPREPLIYSTQADITPSVI